MAVSQLAVSNSETPEGTHDSSSDSLGGGGIEVYVWPNDVMAASQLALSTSETPVAAAAVKVAEVYMCKSGQ
jgi:hypothetical protein